MTGEPRFLDGSLAAAEWIMTTVRTDDDTCAAFHHDPGGTELFTLGWCHGPPGLGWLFRQLELTTGSPQWRTWLRRAARADSASGIPARKYPGFWDNVARCCGSAGLRWSNYEFPDPDPDLPPETTYFRERLASARPCCGCTGTWPATAGPCAGRTPRPGGA